MDLVTRSDELTSLLQALTGRPWKPADSSKLLETGKSESPTATSSSENSELLEGSDSEHESTGSAVSNENGRENGNMSETRHTDENHAASSEAATHMNQAEEQSLNDLRGHPGLKVGEMATSDTFFVPWRLVKDYPNLFVGKANAGKVSKPGRQMTTILLTTWKVAPWFTLQGLHSKCYWDL